MEKPKRIYPELPSLNDGYASTGPDVVGIGAQKAGTSRIAFLLSLHPQFYMHGPLIPALQRNDQHRSLTIKERHFFTYTHVDFNEEHARTYRAWFPKPPGKKTGEFTPRYLYDFWVPAQLAASAPDARLLVILRDPIERFKSGCAHTGNLEPSTVREHFFRGLYHQQLTRWLSYFPRTSMLVIQYEKFTKDPASHLKTCWKFCGVDESFVPDTDDLMRPVNVSKRDKPEIDDNLRRCLLQSYRPDVEALGKDFPEVDVSLWKNF